MPIIFNLLDTNFGILDYNNKENYEHIVDFLAFFGRLPHDNRELYNWKLLGIMPSDF